MTNSRNRNITPRYSSLPLVSMLLKLIGFLLLGFAVAIFLFGVYAMLARGSMAAFGLFLGQLVGGVVLAVVLIAFSELIHVALDIEEHTRRTAEALTGQVTGTTPRAKAPGEIA